MTLVGMRTGADSHTPFPLSFLLNHLSAVQVRVLLPLLRCFLLLYDTLRLEVPGAQDSPSSMFHLPNCALHRCSTTARRRVRGRRCA